MRNRFITAVAVALLVVLAFPTAILASFSHYTDLTGHWAAGYIETLHDLEALDDPPPLFGPSQPISRGKFSKYLVVGWGIIPYTGAETFLGDVPETHRYYRYINALYLRGIMVGSGGVFGVDDKLTREQCATVLVRAAGLEPDAMKRSLAEAHGIVTTAWSDAATISPWAVPYMAQAYVSGLFLGDDVGTVRPKDSISKAEAATVVCRIDAIKPLSDFGDAPDNPPYFWFPSLLVSDGARHQDYKSVWLGRLVDGEIDSRQINMDFFDDGFVKFIPTPTGMCQVQFIVSVASRDTSLYGDSSDKLLYFNLLLDTDQNMTWTPGEWVVQNMKINPNTWPAGMTSVTLMSPPFFTPVDPYKCWYRMTLTWGEPVPNNWVGRGSFLYGETEDYGPEEQKVAILYELTDLVQQWTGSSDAAKQNIGAYLSIIVPLVQDLIDEEQADDPVETLLRKKDNILRLLYEAAGMAKAAGLSQADIDRLFEGLWKKMAFVTEEEVKKHCIHLLREMLRLNFNIPPNVARQILDIIDRIVDLMMEQQQGHPLNVLLAKKTTIIQLLEQLVQALEKLGYIGPADEARKALAWMKFIKALEEPVPPNGPGDPPRDPPWQPPPDDGRPPPDDGGQPLGRTPTLPGLITGVGSVFEVGPNGVLIKVHLTSHGPKGVHDIEIYYDHQKGWPVGATLTPGQGPPGWEPMSGPAGIGWYGSPPLQACQPVYLHIAVDGFSAESITIVLTDENHKPIGHSTSQRVRTGTIAMPPDSTASLAGGESDPTFIPPPDSFFDVFYQDGSLGGNFETGGGILPLPGGLEDLAPGGYLPTEGYLPIVPAVSGEYYALRDHTGEGYALLYVMDISPNGCLLWYEWNPYGEMIMGHGPER